jgi:hypothetical protein
MGDGEGYNNANLIEASERIRKMGTYKNQAIIMVCPTLDWVTVRAMSSWFGLLRPMNQKVAGPFFMNGFEVAKAYNLAVEFALKNDSLKDFPYLLTFEHDNILPRDGLLKLLESIDGGVNGNVYDAVSGLYWTKKQPEGYPLILGNPKEDRENIYIQVPQIDTVQPCNAMGMGFTLFRMSLFKRIEPPWFEETSAADGSVYTRQSQDVSFFLKAGGLGYKFAVDTRVKVGHLDPDKMEVW